MEIVPILMTLAVMLLFGGSLLFIGGLLLRFVRYAQSKGSTPTLDALYGALLPMIYQAIFEGEKFANNFFEDANEKLGGLNRKAIADSMYDRIPDEITVGGKRIPITLFKILVPREQFEVWVKQVYDSALAKFMAQQAFLAKQVERELGKQAVQG